MRNQYEARVKRVRVHHSGESCEATESAESMAKGIEGYVKHFEGRH